MLRAGFKKLRKLEADFAKIDPTATPRCWWCARTPRCRPWWQFLQDQEGLNEG